MIYRHALRVMLIVPAVTLAMGCGSSDSDTPRTSSKAAKIFVADEEDGTISVLDHATNERVATVALPADGDMSMPHNVQAAPDGGSVWVAAPPMMEGGMERVFVIDPKTNELTSSIELGTELHLAHVVLDPTSSRAFVTANEGDSVIEIDAQSRTVSRTVDLGAGAGPHGARFCRDALWVAGMGAKAIIRLAPSSANIQRIDVGGVAVQTACTPDGRFVLASLYDTKEIVRYEIATGELMRVKLPAESQGPVQLYPSPDSNWLWVCDQGLLEGRPASNKLYRVDIGKLEVAGSVDVGTGAHGVVVSEDGARAYVTNTVDSTVSVVDTAALQTIATVDVGKKPNGISHWHVTGGMP